jgi:hypothetical protein
MSLTSPRFNSSRRLINAAGGQTIRQGAPSGRAIHLVQMALIDLGYPMPRSTGSQGYSPDGDFGNETREKLIEFQNANNITPSGAIDRDTMLALDHFCRDYTHRVRMHFRSIALANVPFQESLTWAEIVYGQYGIKMEFASGMSLMLSEEEEERLAQIDGTCHWVIEDADYFELQSLGPPVPSNDLLVYYVSHFSEDLRGCGGHARNRPACIIAASGTKWTTAHESGHVLLTSGFDPVHAPSRLNLMYEVTTVFGNTIPILTDAQVAKIRTHPCCQAI